LDYCFDLLILKLERKINTAEEILKKSDPKPIPEIGKARTSERKGSGIKNLRVERDGKPACTPQCK
jgi:hypothetical protein